MLESEFDTVSAFCSPFKVELRLGEEDWKKEGKRNRTLLVASHNTKSKKLVLHKFIKYYT